MKKVLFACMLLLICSQLSFGQKYAYIDSDYILNNMPSYVEAQAELNRLSLNWQKEIESKFAEIDAMYRKYQQDAILLPEDAKVKRQEEIIAAENAAKELQKKRFGTDGDLYKKREELIKPIQDRVFTAIEEYARERAFAFVFDKAGDMTIVYADAKFDINDEILAKLGIVANSKH